jgi:hypothetical protein
MEQFEHSDNQEVDHIDSDRLNNTRQNLRWCLHSENMANMKIPSNNKSGVKDVSWNMNHDKW